MTDPTGPRQCPECDHEICECLPVEKLTRQEASTLGLVLRTLELESLNLPASMTRITPLADFMTDPEFRATCRSALAKLLAMVPPA